MMLSSNKCLNCGEELQGDYCHQCGEKKLRVEDRSVRVWFQEAFSNLVQLDGKVLKTVIYMVVRPVRIANDYFTGVRRPYLRMINLFFIANLLYFLTPGLQMFKSSLTVQLYNQPYSHLAQQMVYDYMDEGQLDLNQFERDYNAKTAEVSKLILILLVVFLGLVIQLFYRKRLFLSDAFNLALQFWSAYILMFILPVSIMIILVRQWETQNSALGFLFSDLGISVFTLLFSGVYLWFILKGFSTRLWVHTLKIALILGTFVFIFTTYRAILFLLTMLFVSL